METLQLVGEIIVAGVMCGIGALILALVILLGYAFLKNLNSSKDY